MKLLRPLLLASLLALVLTACATDAPTPQTQATQAPEEIPVEKTLIDVLAPLHSGETAKRWAQLEQEFEAANPDFDLEVTCVSWHDLEAALRQRIEEGKFPDLVNSDQLFQYQREGLLLSTDQWVSRETFEKFYPQLHARAAADGAVWGIPDLVSARALYYHPELLEAAGVSVPGTWDELITVCYRLLEYDWQLYPLGMDLTTDEGYLTFACYLWNNGSDFRDEYGAWCLNAAETQQAVEFALYLVNDGLTNPDPTNQTRYDCQELFAQGKVAMMIAPSSLPAYCSSVGYPVSYSIAPLPSNGAAPSVSTASGNFLMCFRDESRSPRELEAIMALTDVFYRDASYARWVSAEGFLPATVPANALLGQENPEMAVWDQILGSLKFLPTQTAQWDLVREGTVAVLQEALYLDNVWLALENLQAQVMGQ